MSQKHLESPLTHTVRPLDSRFRGNDTATEDKLPLWALCAPDPEPEPSRPLVPSKPDEDEPPMLAPHDARFARGRIVHRLLQSLPDVESGKQETAAQRYLKNPQLNLNEGQQRDIAREVFALLRHPEFAPLFGPKSRAEVPLTGIVGNRAIAGQVDRLCVKGGEVWIVDYKTNRPAPSRVQDVPRVYLRQMAAYRDVLKAVYPDKKIRAFLVWTYDARLMPIRDNALDVNS
jgi:ATP-dependent helicase/nuclease subunit A